MKNLKEVAKAIFNMSDMTKSLMFWAMIFIFGISMEKYFSNLEATTRNAMTENNFISKQSQSYEYHNEDNTYSGNLEQIFEYFLNKFYTKPEILIRYDTDTLSINNIEISIDNTNEDPEDGATVDGFEYLVNNRRFEFEEGHYLGNAEIRSNGDKYLFYLHASTVSTEPVILRIFYIKNNKLEISKEDPMMIYKGAESNFSETFFKNKVYKTSSGKILFVMNDSPYISAIRSNLSIKSIEVPKLFTLDEVNNVIIPYVPTDEKEVLYLSNFYKNMSAQSIDNIAEIIKNNPELKHNYPYEIEYLFARKFQLDILSGLSKEEAKNNINTNILNLFPENKFKNKSSEIINSINESIIN